MGNYSLEAAKVEKAHVGISPSSAGPVQLLILPIQVLSTQEALAAHCPALTTWSSLIFTLFDPILPSLTSPLSYNTSLTFTSLCFNLLCCPLSVAKAVYVSMDI